MQTQTNDSGHVAGGKTEAGPSLDSRIANELSLHPGHRHCNTCPFDHGDTHERDCSFPNCVAESGPSDAKLARMLVAAEAFPKLGEAEMIAICTSRGWSVDSQPEFREIAEVFFAEGCAAQRARINPKSWRLNKRNRIEAP